MKDPISTQNPLKTRGLLFFYVQFIINKQNMSTFSSHTQGMVISKSTQITNIFLYLGKSKWCSLTKGTLNTCNKHACTLTFFIFPSIIKMIVLSWINQCHGFLWWFHYRRLIGMYFFKGFAHYFSWEYCTIIKKSDMPALLFSLLGSLEPLSSLFFSWFLPITVG